MTVAGIAGAPTTNAKLLAWVEEVAALTQPDRVEWCDGSQEEWDRLTQLLVDGGTFTRLNPRRRARTRSSRARNPSDVARVEDRTFICSLHEEDAGPTNNWADPVEMRATLQGAVRRLDARPHDVRHPVLDGPARLARSRSSASRSPTRRTSWSTCGS